MKTIKSRTKGELIPSVVIQFRDLPGYYWTKEQWQDNGGYKGFLKTHEMSIMEIEKVNHVLLNPSDFPTQAWEG